MINGRDRDNDRDRTVTGKMRTSSHDLFHWRLGSLGIPSQAVSRDNPFLHPCQPSQKIYLPISIHTIPSLRVETRRGLDSPVSHDSATSINQVISLTLYRRANNYKINLQMLPTTHLIFARMICQTRFSYPIPSHYLLPVWRQGQVGRLVRETAKELAQDLQCE